MSTKVVARDPHDHFFLWADTTRVNADVVPCKSADGRDMFMIRLRPWKQDKRTPTMFVGVGETVYEAMRDVLNTYKTGEEQALDYAYRPWRPDPAAVELPF